MQSVNFILCCANLHRMNEKLLLHGHCLFLRMPKQSFTTFGYSLLQNSVKPIQIKQKLRFFKADEYISRVFGLRLLNSIIFFFIQIHIGKTMFTWPCRKQLLKFLTAVLPL